MTIETTGLPVLYSFRRCPYAIRARLAIAVAEVQVELREVVLRDKPAELLAASSKGTVPVLVAPTGDVIDESIDIMRWALEQSDPEQWLYGEPGAEPWIAANDGEFKHWLDRYKYADRYPEQPGAFYRQRAETFLRVLEDTLVRQAWLGGNHAALADAAVFPFIRQFAGVDSVWFAAAPYPALRHWLEHWLTRPLFQRVMGRYPAWQPWESGVHFPG